MRPVPRTTPPSLTAFWSPRITAPISVSSRLKATPRILPASVSNSTISWAATWESPEILATPSPTWRTSPTFSNRPSVLNPASRSRSSLMIFSACAILADQFLFKVLEITAKRGVQEFVADFYHHSPDEPFIHFFLQLDVAAHVFVEFGDNLFFLFRAKRLRRRDLRGDYPPRFFFIGHKFALDRVHIPDIPVFFEHRDKIIQNFFLLRWRCL